MKPETELKWIVNLLNSPYVKGLFKSKGGCKKEIERVCGSSENNREFYKWFNYLLENGAIEEFGKTDSHSKPVTAYVIIYKKMDKILIKNPLYDKITNVMDKKFLLRASK